MAATIKAGIEHIIKVNTKADRMGFEAGFKMDFFNDATKAYTAVTENFFEFEKDITATSTTVDGAHSAGTKTIAVADATGFTSGESAKVGGEYYRIVNVDANNITLKKGLVGAIADGDSFELSGRTGTYGVPVTFTDAGNYTLHITNFGIGMDNEPAPIVVQAANIDDVKTLLDAVKVEVDSVKAQVDTLDEEELNGISEKVDTLATELTSVHTLIKDSSDVYFEVSGDETAKISVDTTLTGDTSGATGDVQYVSYDAEADVTKVTVQSVSGTFEEDETVNNGTESTTGTISSIANNVVNSVIEFVKEIKELLGSESGLDALKAVNKDIEHILYGDAELENGDTCPTDGKGLVAIFDSIATSDTEVKQAISDLSTSVTDKFGTLQTDISDAKSSIEGKIAALVDEDNSDSLISKVNAVKSVVDANQGLLENSTYGLSKIMDGINGVAALFEDGGAIEVRFDNIDTALGDLTDALNAQTTHIDGKFDDVMSALTGMNDATKFTVFA